tara:strand:- start:2400 stop:2696 length:297 start_codon:yes stop_codon:yes gene_type:complete
MASKFFSGKKADPQTAISKLMQHTAGVFDGRFHAKVESDDGGSHITLYVEVEDPNKPMDSFLVDALHVPKWMGWRFILCKCPPGYIDAILTAVKRDDY